MNEFLNKRNPNASFRVKNIVNKSITFFNYKINPGITVDLIKIPNITEEIIKSSLLKGTLYNKIKSGELEVVFSDLGMVQFNNDQEEFLSNNNISFINEDSVTDDEDDIFQVEPVATLNALSAVADIDLENGTLIYVESLKAHFLLDKNSSTTVEDHNIIATLSGTGRWIRNIESKYWLNQTTWYIDPTSGDNENSGLTSILPIKTWRELVRRIGHTPQIRTRIDVYFLGDIPSTDPVNLRPTLTNGGFLYLHGVKTSIASGTLTTVTARVTATNTPLQLTDTSMTWTSHVGKFVEITAGARLGAGCWIAKDLGSNTCRATSLMTISAENGTTVSSSEVVPQVGDAYSIYTFSKVAVLDIIITNNNDLVALSNRIVVDYINVISTGLHGSIYGTLSINPNRSFLIRVLFSYRIFFHDTSLINCFFDNDATPSFTVHTSIAMIGGGWLVFFNASIDNKITFSSGFLFQSTGGIVLISGNNGCVECSDCGIFDWSGAFFTIRGSYLYIGTAAGSSGKLWGSSATSGSYVVNIASGKLGIIVNTTGLTAVGQTTATKDFQIKGAVSGPAYDSTIPGYTANRNYTFALVGTSVASLGFGGNAVDPSSGIGLFTEV